MNSADPELYSLNIEALCAKYPGFRTDIVGKYKASSVMTSSISAEGSVTAKAGSAWLHSSRAPVREAARLDTSAVNGKGVCVVYGFGLGYHIEFLLQTFPELKLLVVEPDPSLFLEALYLKDFTPVINSGRTDFAFDVKASNIPGILSEYGNMPVSTLKLRSLYSLSAEYYSELDVELDSYLSRKQTNMNTLRRFGKAWVKNLFGNLETFGTAGDAGCWYGQFPDTPAIVTAAGPSLDLVLPLLPELKKRMLIICVDTALQAVLSSGTIPDFIFVVDPQYLNTRHLDNCLGSSDLILRSKNNAPSAVLISESSTHPLIFRKCTLPVYFFKSVFPLGKKLESLAGIESEIRTGGSVATTAWDFAVKLGCPEIYTAGLDLGYPGQNTHCRTSLSAFLTALSAGRLLPAETINFSSVRGAGPFREANNTGGETLTDKRLIIYKWWFEKRIREKPGFRFLHTSPEGLRIEGMEFRDPDSLLSGTKLRSRINERISRTLGFTCRRQAAGINSLRDTAATIAAECSRLEALCSEASDLSGKLGQAAGLPSETSYRDILKRLSDIDRKILESPSKELSGFIIQPVINEIIDGDQGGIDNSMKLYLELHEACRYHRLQAERALKRLKN